MVEGRPPVQELPRDEICALTADEQPGALLCLLNGTAKREYFASVVSHFNHEGWKIESVANAEARARGADIRATRSDELFIVEAKRRTNHTAYFGGQNRSVKVLRERRHLD